MTDSPAGPAPAAPAAPAGRQVPLGVPVVGMVGGGQLARMTAQAAIGLGVGFRVLADSAADSAAQVAAGTRIGDYRSLEDVRAFAAGCDVLTFDHEHVPGGGLAALEAAGVQVRPSAAALRFTQDKLAMRERLAGLGISCPRFTPVATLAEVEAFAAGRWPVVLKAVSGGYDGKGVWVCGSADEAAERAGPRPAADGGGVCRLRPRAGRAGGPLAAPPGRGVPGGGDRPAGWHLPRGDRARTRPGRRPAQRRPRSWPCASPGSSA